jgi:integrase
VRTAKQLSTFLAGAVEDSLVALWWLAALRGLRRGELCGLRWAAVDLDRGLLFVERQRTTAGYEIVEGDPKTAAGCRAVALDKHTVAILREHRRRQLERGDRRHAANMAWDDSGYVFTRKDGQPINPNYATTRFRKLTERAGLPPVRSHDLRHGAASLAHEAAERSACGAASAAIRFPTPFKPAVPPEPPESGQPNPVDKLDAIMTTCVAQSS